MASIEFYREQAAKITTSFGLSVDDKAQAYQLGTVGLVEREKLTVFQAMMGSLARIVIKKMANEMVFQEGEWLDYDATNTAIALMGDHAAIAQMESVFDRGSLDAYGDYPIKTEKSAKLLAEIRAFEDSM